MREGHTRRTVRIVYGQQFVGSVVAIRRHDTTGPCASCEFSVGRIGVDRPVAVGIDLVRQKPRRLVVEPSGNVKQGVVEGGILFGIQRGISCRRHGD